MKQNKTVPTIKSREDKSRYHLKLAMEAAHRVSTSSRPRQSAKTCLKHLKLYLEY